MRHVPHVNESCHIYEYVGSHPCKTSFHKYEWAVSSIWISRVTHVSESSHTNVWVMTQICMSHVTHIHESWHIYEWVTRHIWMSHTTHKYESCHTHKCDSGDSSFRKYTPRMGHVTHMNKACHTHCTYEWVMSHIRMSMNGACHTHEWDMSHWHVTHMHEACPQSPYTMHASWQK